MFIPILEAPELRAARHICYHYGVGGHTGGTFASALIRLIETADDENRERLLTAYPDYRKPVHIATTMGVNKLLEAVETTDRLRGAPTVARDGVPGPATAAAMMLGAHAGIMPDAITVLCDVRNKIDSAEKLGISPTQYIARYLDQLAKHGRNDSQTPGEANS